MARSTSATRGRSTGSSRRSPSTGPAASGSTPRPQVEVGSTRFVGMAPITVLLADDEPLMLQALAGVLEGEASLGLAATAMTADQAIDLAGRLRPDVAVLDVRMTGGGPRAARGIRARSPQTKVIAFSAYDDKASVLEMLASGAVGYVLKGAAGEEM